MKILLSGLLFAAIHAHLDAKPSADVLDSCLRAESNSPSIHYTQISVRAFNVSEDEETGRTETTFRYGRDTIGTWRRTPPRRFGLIFNGMAIPLRRVTLLDQRQRPAEFDPYEAIWAEARAGRRSYICATFNFDGLGKSGNFQYVRGLYLIERGTRGNPVFYIAGKVEPN